MANKKLKSIKFPNITDKFVVGDPTATSGNLPKFDSNGFLVDSGVSASGVAQTADLADVATSGSYNDLTNKPTIPSAYVLPNASTSTLGGVKIDGTSITIDSNGVISGYSDDVMHRTIAAQWNAETEYDAGDYCVYNHYLWLALVQNTGVTPVDGTTWAVVSVATMLQVLASMDKAIILTSYQYGTTLPEAGTAGRIFFLKA